MNVAIIPARGGSKRIPRKNIRDFCGRPMMAWPIAAAVQSACFDRILVSTDDPEVAEVAVRCGAEVPFVRPASLANDYAGTMEVVAHAIGWLQEQGSTPQAVCCIYATAALVRAEDLRQGLAALQASGCDFAFPVTSFAAPIQRALRINAQGRLEMFQPEFFHARSQDLEPAYHDAGQFYWGRPDAWLAGVPLFSSLACPVLLPRYRVQDIDTPEDWERAESLFRSLGHAG